MTSLRFGSLLLFGGALWAASQPALTDSLSSIDSSKWTQNGSLSASSNGLSGTGSLVSKVPVATGNDYDVSMTIHTVSRVLCTGSYSLYARSNADNQTAYALTVSDESISLLRELAGSWTLLTWMPYHCADGAVMRLVVRGSNLTFWSGSNAATYVDPTPIATGQPWGRHSHVRRRNDHECPNRGH